MRARTRTARAPAGLKKWKQHCADFREAGKGLAKALAFRKAAKAKKALGVVTAQCEACHKDHKSD